MDALDGRMSATEKSLTAAEKSLEDVRHRTEMLERRNASSTASSISADGGTGECRSSDVETLGLDTAGKTDGHCRGRLPEGHAEGAHCSKTP